MYDVDSRTKVSGKGLGVCDTMRAYFEESSFIGLVTVDSDGSVSAKRMLSPAAAGMRGSSDFAVKVGHAT